MIYNVYCVQDKKSVWMTPTIDMTDESAMRNFSYAISKTEGLMAYAPSDFALYCLGQFDASSGKLRPLDVPELVIDGSSIEVKKND